METLGGAWDSFMSLFDSGPSAPEINENNYGPLKDGGAYGDFLDDGTDNNSVTDWSASTLSKVDSDSKGAWYTNPNLLGAGITAGAGLLNGMGAQDTQRRATAAALEQAKMKNLLELAQLKHSILMKGSGGSGRRASGGGSGAANQAAAVDRQLSANKVSQLSNLGSNLANIYRG